MSRQAAPAFLCAIMLLCILAQLPSPASESIPEGLPNTAGIAPYVGQLPALADAFTANMGQLDNSDVLFYAPSGGVAFTRDSVMLYALGEEATRGDFIRGVALSLSFVGANDVLPEGRTPAPWTSNYFTGNGPESWRTGVANYREIFYENIWDGIDLRYYMGAAGMKYDLILNPGADCDQISIRVTGQEGLGISENGDLSVDTGLGPGSEILDSKPVVFYADGPEESIGARFVLTAADTYSFELENPDTSRRIIIDPLIYSTFLGGSDSDTCLAVAVDADGHAYVTGDSYSTSFPTVPGSFDIIHNSVNDVFVAKISPSGGHMIYSTFIGGAGYDVGHAIAVDATGCAYVTGETLSTGFPITSGAYDRTYNGAGDAFVTKLGPNGDTLEYSTFLGGKHDEAGYGIAVDGDGHAHITGYTWSGSFPVTQGAHSINLAGDSDAFISKLGPNGDILLYSTFIGGSGCEQGRAIRLDSEGLAFVAGSTRSTNFPLTPGAFNTTSNGTDIFAIKMAKSGGSLVYSSRFGGENDDIARAMDVDAKGNVYLTGETASADFPVTAGALNGSFSGVADAFITKLSPSGGTLEYSTFLGGSRYDSGRGIAVGADGSAHVTGHTSSPDLPTTLDAIDRTFNGGSDAFLARISPSGGAIIYSTYLGGSLDDHGNSVVLDAHANAFVAGDTSSSDFLTTYGALETSFSGVADAFIAKFDITIPVAVAGPDMVVNESTPVTLDGSASHDNLAVENYTWSFNDGADDVALYGPKPTHVFKVPGTYAILLNVSDAVGNWNTDQMNITVLVYPLPTAVVGPDIVISEGAIASFDGSGSQDNIGIVSYLWTFHDGLNSPALDSASPDWRFNLPGTYQATLVVWDAEGNNDSASLTVTVLDTAPPVAAMSPAVQISRGMMAEFDASASRDNVGIVNHTWEFTHNGTAVTLYGESAGYRFWSPGTYTVTLTVEDASGNRASNVMAVTVSPLGEGGDGSQWAHYVISAAASAAILLVALWIRKRMGRKQAAEDEPGQKEAEQ